MIGVIADRAQERVIQEFFELFKTPWEFYHQDTEYDVLLCSGGANPPQAKARLIIHYTTETRDEASLREFLIVNSVTGRVAVYKGQQLPLYGESTTFRTKDTLQFHDEASSLSLSHNVGCGQSKILTIGYKLFDEVLFLLNEGQPESFSMSPALDLHISLLRDVIVAHGAELVEIPPTPIDHPFIACLTHDVDHPMLRRHIWDRTALGFCYRASWGSLKKTFRSRMTVRDLWHNFCTLASLPLIWLGIRKDLWSQFVHEYEKIEKELPSTYYFIPFEGRPGRTRKGLAPAHRAAGYKAADLAPEILAIKQAGREVGLHGIDAWIDADAGREELQEIRSLAGIINAGVRMHWLYFDQRSPKYLEDAGATYDSTVGYNGAVGYRAGTTQSYLPLAAQQLMELPLHIMDTALFYPSHMGLSQNEADEWTTRIIEHAFTAGGCVTINWHDRSLFPERHWGIAYSVLIQKLRDRGAWFTTATEAVAWFRKRRAVTFTRSASTNDCEISLKDDALDLPELRIRIWNHPLFQRRDHEGHSDYFDMPLHAYLTMSQTTVSAPDTTTANSIFTTSPPEFYTQ